MDNKLPGWEVLVCGFAVCATTDPDKCESCNVPQYVRGLSRNGEIEKILGEENNRCPHKGQER